MESIKKFWDSFDDASQKGLSIALAIIMLFSSGYIAGSFTKIAETESAPVVNADATTSKAPEAPQSTAAPVITTTAPTTAPAPIESTTGSAPVTSAPASTDAPSSKEEIVALFNEASDRVKTDATKVVKNFENRDFDSANSVIPSGLDSLATSLIGKYLTDDTEPIEYATKEDITAQYPVPNESYSSKLTAADVAEATCTDNGTEYEIILKLNTTENPVQGAGVGAACDVIESSQITSNGAVSKILKEFTVTYSDCVIKCKIDKATKHITWSNYLTPVTIDALVSVVISTVDAKVIFSFEKDYTITY